VVVLGVHGGSGSVAPVADRVYSYFSRLAKYVMVVSIGRSHLDYCTCMHASVNKVYFCRGEIGTGK
jgi:hypothetical protein